MIAKGGFSMATLKSVLDLYSAVNLTTKLVGATADFNQEFHQRGREISIALAREQQRTLEGAAELSPETLLGEESEAKFSELRHWLASQSEYFESYVA